MKSARVFCPKTSVRLILALVVSIGLTGAAEAAVPVPGVITEFSLPTASRGPFEITAGPDGALWFTVLTNNKIGRITPTGTVTEFLIPTANSRPWGITAGPDGNLWFTEESGNKIGRITPTGVVLNEFALPTLNS